MTGSSVTEELLPIDCLNFNDFSSVLSHNFVTKGLNFMRLILSIYDLIVVVHVKFYQVVISYRAVIAL